MLRNVWFSYDLGNARADCFEKLGCENLKLLQVFVKIDLEILTKLVVWERFRHARAAERACGPYGAI